MRYKDCFYKCAFQHITKKGAAPTMAQLLFLYNTLTYYPMLNYIDKLN